MWLASIHLLYCRDDTIQQFHEKDSIERLEPFMICQIESVNLLK